MRTASDNLLQASTWQAGQLSVVILPVSSAPDKALFRTMDDCGTGLMKHKHAGVEDRGAGEHEGPGAEREKRFHYHRLPIKVFKLGMSSSE